MGPKIVASGSKLSNSTTSKNSPTKAKTVGKSTVQKKSSPDKAGTKATKVESSRPKKVASSSKSSNPAASKNVPTKTKTGGKEVVPKKDSTASAETIPTKENVADVIVKCDFKQLNALLEDEEKKIMESGRWPLLIDTSEKAAIFLKYRNTNYLNALNSRDMEMEMLRLALLGAIRYGKSLVIDMMDINLLSFFQARCNDVQDNLYEELVSKDILKDKRYLSLIRPNDGEEYSERNFVDMYVETFMLVIVTKLEDIPKDWMNVFYGVKITPSVT